MDIAVATEGQQKGGLKKRHIGIVGLITLLMQYGVGVKNDKVTRDSLRAIAQSEMVKVQEQINSLREERDREFFRKQDVSNMLARIDQKVDKLDDNVNRISAKVSRVEGFLRANSKGIYSSIEESRWTTIR